MIAGGGLAQSSSSASSSVSSINGSVDVRLGGFVFESGASVALEFARAETVNCFRPNVSVQQLQLIDDQGDLVNQIIYDPAADIDGWLGQIQLGSSDGQPLPLGNYSLIVTTSAGSFVAEIEVADVSRFDELDHYRATATVCGVSLRVYRLVSEEDDGTHITLRLGDCLLVVLRGNPTTGYEWWNTLLYEFASLREIGEPEFQPDSSRMGAGGRFLFRYETVAVGSQAFHFIYHRPWESVNPLEVLEFSVDVH